MRTFIVSLVFLALPLTSAHAAINVVATLPWIGSLVREIAQDRVSVTTLVKPGQNPHIIEARPSMILAARKADIIMYNGLDLEIGYLPTILESARNPKIVPGKSGNFDCSRFVAVLEKPVSVDRSMGDVHPLGNPHYHYSPASILKVAEGMSTMLAELDRPNAASYRANYEDFARRVQARQQQWRRLPLKGRKFVAYHKLFEYLAASFGFRIIAYLEQKPGIPPSAGHIENIIETIKASHPQGILTSGHHGHKEAASVADRTGVRVIPIPADVGSERGTDDWISFMDTVLADLK